MKVIQQLKTINNIDQEWKFTFLKIEHDDLTIFLHMDYLKRAENVNDSEGVHIVFHIWSAWQNSKDILNEL